ncbi:MAG: sterol desaturase family protein [Pseudobdellovibrio sp.]
MWFLLGFVILLLLVEKFRPLKIIAKDRSTSFFWLFANLLALTLVLNELQPRLTILLKRLNLPQLLNFLSLPIYLQLILFFLIFDFFKFVTHWAFHESGWLWKFHSVHHSSTEIDTLASYKHSWPDALINSVLTGLFLQFIAVNEVLGMPMTYFFSVICILQHTNINFDFLKFKFLTSLFITPSTHRIHHHKEHGARRVNLGFVLTIWDRLFKTYSDQIPENQTYGIDEYNYPNHSNLRQLFYPFLSLKQSKLPRAKPE